MPGSRDARPYRRAEDAAWQVDELRPDILGNVYRYKTLLGTPGTPCPDAAMGILELNPGTYPFHEHPAPEAYYVIRGRAAWTVGKRTFQAREGTAIYHLPGIPHRMVNRADEPLVALWFWWAPGGRTSVLREPSRLSPRPGRRGIAPRER
jgi:quercetin dioxygenase-like cupin family protein